MAVKTTFRCQNDYRLGFFSPKKTKLSQYIFAYFYNFTSLHLYQPCFKHSMFSFLITHGHLKGHKTLWWATFPFTQWAHVLQLHESNPSHCASNQNLLTFHASSSSDVHLSFRMGRTAQMNSAPTYWEIIEKYFSGQSVCMSPLCRCIKICAWPQTNYMCSIFVEGHWGLTL